MPEFLSNYTPEVRQDASPSMPSLTMRFWLTREPKTIADKRAVFVIALRRAADYIEANVEKPWLAQFRIKGVHAWQANEENTEQGNYNSPRRWCVDVDLTSDREDHAPDIIIERAHS